MARHPGSSCAKSHHDTFRYTNYRLNTASSRQFALGFRTPDLTDAIEFPILLMIIVPKELLEGITDDPSSGGPWVMWGDTDYAHLMVPVK